MENYVAPGAAPLEAPLSQEAAASTATTSEAAATTDFPEAVATGDFPEATTTDNAVASGDFPEAEATGAAAPVGGASPSSASAALPSEAGFSPSAAGGRAASADPIDVPMSPLAAAAPVLPTLPVADTLPTVALPSVTPASPAATPVDVLAAVASNDTASTEAVSADTFRMDGQLTPRDSGSPDEKNAHSSFRAEVLRVASLNEADGAAQDSGQDVRRRFQFLNAADQKTTVRRECHKATKGEDSLLAQVQRTIASYAEAIEMSRVCERLPDGEGKILSEEDVTKYEDRIKFLQGTAALLEEEPKCGLPKLTALDQTKGLIFASYAQTASVVKDVGDSTGVTEKVVSGAERAAPAAQQALSSVRGAIASLFSSSSDLGSAEVTPNPNLSSVATDPLSAGNEVPPLDAFLQEAATTQSAATSSSRPIRPTSPPGSPRSSQTMQTTEPVGEQNVVTGTTKKADATEPVMGIPASREDLHLPATQKDDVSTDQHVPVQGRSPPTSTPTLQGTGKFSMPPAKAEGKSNCKGCNGLGTTFSARRGAAWMDKQGWYEVFSCATCCDDSFIGYSAQFGDPQSERELTNLGWLKRDKAGSSFDASPSASTAPAEAATGS